MQTPAGEVAVFRQVERIKLAEAAEAAETAGGTGESCGGHVLTLQPIERWFNPRPFH